MGSPQEPADAGRSPFDALLGVRLEEASPDRVVLRLPLRRALLQPGGIVHGGVYATLVESAASVGANLWLWRDDRDGSAPRPEARSAVAVGVSNQTDFLRATSEGALRAVATPLQRGRTLQVWVVEVLDDDGRAVAHGKLRLANRERT